MKIVPIHTLETNYTYIIHCEEGVIVIDPGESAVVDQYLVVNDMKLIAVLLTHKHWDHVNGVEALVAKYGSPVFGGSEEIFDFEVSKLFHEKTIEIGGLAVTPIHLPGHTMGAIGILIGSALFSGDVLFGAGCGRLFEGSAEDMLLSMDRIAALDDNIEVYFGHEYTVDNLKFAKAVEPSNEDIQIRINTLMASTTPSSVKLEKATNPFLRIDCIDVVNAVNQAFDLSVSDRAQRLGLLRKWKDGFDQGEL